MMASEALQSRERVHGLAKQGRVLRNLQYIH